MNPVRTAAMKHQISLQSEVRKAASCFSVCFGWRKGGQHLDRGNAKPMAARNENRALPWIDPHEGISLITFETGFLQLYGFCDSAQ